MTDHVLKKTQQQHPGHGGPAPSQWQLPPPHAVPTRTTHPPPPEHAQHAPPAEDRSWHWVSAKGAGNIGPGAVAAESSDQRPPPATHCVVGSCGTQRPVPWAARASAQLNGQQQGCAEPGEAGGKAATQLPRTWEERQGPLQVQTGPQPHDTPVVELSSDEEADDLPSKCGAIEAAAVAACTPAGEQEEPDDGGPVLVDVPTTSRGIQLHRCYSCN